MYDGIVGFAPTDNIVTKHAPVAQPFLTYIPPVEFIDQGAGI
jgi:hypothetical protein